MNPSLPAKLAQATFLASLFFITPTPNADAQCQRLRSQYSDPLPSVRSRFGNSVDLVDNLIVVGAPFEDVGLVDSGSAYIIAPVGGSPSFPAIQNPEPQPGAFFGYSVATHGDLILVGAPGFSFPAPQSGRAYLYDARTKRLLRAIPSPVVRTEGFFGAEVAMSDDHICIGASGVSSIPGFLHCFTSTGELLGSRLSPTPMPGDFFGFSISISGSRVLVGAPGAFGNDGAAYLIEIATGAVLRVFRNPMPTGDPFFGWAVAISGDMVVIGTPTHDLPAPDTGIVFLFNATTGQLLRSIQNPAPGAGDHFGQAVAISGNNILIGSPDDDYVVPDSGFVWMFDAQTGALKWSFTKSNAQAGDFFGHALAFRGDEIVASAPLDNEGGLDNGSVYYFTCGPSLDCSPDAVAQSYTAPGQADFDHLGKSVALSERCALVGAPDDDTAALDAGAAQIFDLTTGAHLTTLHNPDPTELDRFGWAVAISGATAVVGAPNDDENGTDTGRVYIFDALTGDLRWRLHNPVPELNDHFGFSVAASESLTLVGAPGDVSQKGTDAAKGTDPDGAFLFDSTTGALRWTLINPTHDRRDAFGISVALSGPYAVIGATAVDAVAPGAGRVYVFDIVARTRHLTLDNPNPESQLGFGFAVAASGGVDLLVGAFQDDAENNDGMAYLFDLPTGALRKTLTIAEPVTEFGSSVALAGDRAVVGSPKSAFGALAAGRAYLYDIPSGTLMHIYTNPSPAAGEEFGKALGIWDDRVLIGAPYDARVASNSGAAYLFGCVNNSKGWENYE